MPAYQLLTARPVVEKGAYVHPTAVLIGDVIVKKDCFVGPYAVMRGDFARLTLETGANLQEHCCVHTFPDQDVLIEAGGHIGHGAILHGCTIKENAMVGINSVIMDRAVIGKNSIVGAQSLVKSDFIVPANSLAIGSPAKVMRELRAEEIDWKSRGTAEYRMLAAVYSEHLQETDPDTVVEANRARISLSNYELKADLTKKG